MPVFHRPASVILVVAFLAGGSFAQSTLTPEDEVLAMLREWRKVRAARGKDPMPAPVQSGQVGDVGDVPTRIRVGSDVQEQARIFGPYPEEFQTSDVEGLVNLEALIGTDGSVQSLTVIDGDPLLAAAAIQSVKKWTYRPTLLNGMPAEVVTRIEVRFGSAARVPKKR